MDYPMVALDIHGMQIASATHRRSYAVKALCHALKVSTSLVMHCDYKTRDQARASLFEYMEVFYNRQRRHSTIHYVAPLAFEASTIA
jgi:hypothetical protein